MQKKYQTPAGQTGGAGFSEGNGFSRIMKDTGEFLSKEK
jgi:hypothetical protein